MKLSSLFVALAAISAASLVLADYRPPPAMNQVAPSPPAPASQPPMAPARATQTQTAAPAAEAAPAAAAAAAPAAATSNGSATYPGPTCTTPNYPGKTGTDEQILAFNRDFKNYGDCIRKYVDDARNMSNTAIEAGNKAVLEYNKYADDVRKQIAVDKAAK